MPTASSRKSRSTPSGELRELVRDFVIVEPKLNRVMRPKLRPQKSRHQVFFTKKNLEELNRTGIGILEVTRLLKAYQVAVKQSISRGAPLRFGVEVNADGRVVVRSIAPIAVDQRAKNPVVPESEREIETALEQARARGEQTAAAILSGPEMLTSEEFATLLGVSKVAVHDKRERHEVLGLEGAKRGYKFPRWQIGRDGKPLEGLSELFEKFDGRPWAVYRFLVQHHDELNGRTGINALEAGDTELTLSAADAQVRGDFS